MKNNQDSEEIDQKDFFLMQRKGKIHHIVGKDEGDDELQERLRRLYNIYDFQKY